MNTIRFLILVTTVSITSFTFGQSTTEKIDKVVNRFCECAKKSDDGNELDNCGKILDALNNVLQSKEDSLYLLANIKNECGGQLGKGSGLKKNEVKLCYFLSGGDLIKYNLIQTQTEIDKLNNSFTWKPKNPDESIIESILDSRSKYLDEEEAQKKGVKSKQRIIGENQKIEEFDTEFKIPIEVYSMKFPSIGIFYYCVFFQYKTFTGFTLISLKSDDKNIIQEIAEIIANSVHDCE